MVTFSGEHDLNTAPELRGRLAGAIEGESPIVVDLSGAAFIDSSIIGAVLDARREAHEKGLGFAVALSQGAQPVGARARGHRPRLHASGPPQPRRGGGGGASGAPAR